MAKYYLFGSMARKIAHGDAYDGPTPSDVDVIMIPSDTTALKQLQRYAIENGGPLDLFFFAGDQLWAAVDEHRVIILTKSIRTAIAEDLYEVSLSELLNILENFDGSAESTGII